MPIKNKINVTLNSQYGYIVSFLKSKYFSQIGGFFISSTNNSYGNDKTHFRNI